MPEQKQATPSPPHINTHTGLTVNSVDSEVMTVFLVCMEGALYVLSNADNTRTPGGLTGNPVKEKQRTCHSVMMYPRVGNRPTSFLQNGGCAVE